MTWRWVIVAAVACATILTVVVALEEHLIYYPTRFPEGSWDTERVSRGSGCSLEDCFFAAADGVKLHGWWCRPQEAPGAALPVVLFFHGNAGNLSDRADLVLRLARLGADVVIVDYRGYGRSEGRPSERGLYRDADAAWRFLTEDRGVAPSRIVVLGRSLGGAVAVDLASRVEPAGLIVESSFSSMRDMAARYFPWVPRALLRTRMDSAAKILSVRAPKLHIHSPDDEVVPYALGRRLFEAAPEPKRFVEVAGAGHNETYLVGGAAYFEAIGRFIAECTAPAEGRTP